MAYEDLIKAIEANAEERTREIRQRAENQAEEVVEKARNQVERITGRHREEAIRRAEIERNRIVSGIIRDTKLQVVKAKAEILERVFALAEQELVKSRQRPSYEASFRSFLLESLAEMSGDSVRVHLDPRDEPLCRKLVKELSPDPEIVADLHCAGGLNVSSNDDTFIILDTIESRFEKARELLRPEIYTILYGG